MSYGCDSPVSVTSGYYALCAYEYPRRWTTIGSPDDRRWLPSTSRDEPRPLRGCRHRRAAFRTSRSDWTLHLGTPPAPPGSPPAQPGVISRNGNLRTVRTDCLALRWPRAATISGKPTVRESIESSPLQEPLDIVPSQKWSFLGRWSTPTKRTTGGGRKCPESRPRNSVPPTVPLRDSRLGHRLCPERADAQSGGQAPTPMLSVRKFPFLEFSPGSTAPVSPSLRLPVAASRRSRLAPGRTVC
jgi:hypothetical protein